MSTFLCSLRPGPAAAGLLEGLFLYGDGLIGAGVGPTFLHKRGHSLLFYCRCRGSAGPGLRSQGSSGGGSAFALCAREV